MSPHSCFFCKSKKLEEVIDLGEMPLSHHLRKRINEQDLSFHIKYGICLDCGLLQISKSVPAEILYSSDTYTTGFQKPKHIEDLLTAANSYRNMSSALDIGCNDGQLLESLKKYGFDLTVGVEPNQHAANKTKNLGHIVYNNFLDKMLAENIKQDHGCFDAIYARHVVEHIENISDFYNCIQLLLAPDGIFVMEIPQVEVGFDYNSPVILWEEHVTYFTEGGAKKMLASQGFEVLCMRYYSYGGGSLAFICKKNKKKPFKEKLDDKYDIKFFKKYDLNIRQLKENLSSLIFSAKENGYDIAVYGAAPRSCTILNYAELGRKIDYVIDDREDIQGRIMPGTEKYITSLKESNFGDRPLLVLLGVGAENEKRVLSKLSDKLNYAPVNVSMFPPRDIWSSIELAKQIILQSNYNKQSG